MIRERSFFLEAVSSVKKEGNKIFLKISLQRKKEIEGVNKEYPDQE